MPIRRITIAELALSRTVARYAAAKYVKGNQRFICEMKEVLQKAATAKKRFDKRIRIRTDSGTTNSTVKETVILRTGSDSDLSAQRSWFTRLIMGTNDPLVIQKDVSPPITDAQVLHLLPKDTLTPARCIREEELTQESAEVEIREEVWTWEELSKELTRMKDTVEWIDVRDFPKHGELEKLSPAACELFRWVGPFPGVKDPANLGSTTALTHQLCGLAEWCKERTGGQNGRDAQEKVYIAFGSRSEDKNEAGAMKVLLWVQNYNTANAIQLPRAAEDRVLLPKYGAAASGIDSSDEDMDRRPVGAEWWWCRDSQGRQCSGSSRLRPSAITKAR
ncbi:hypothetical protein A4X13_0g6628 [Tilletia indica]|uniref:Uncharacterized protein n=1 Tax=Tilletia indica TaxID=43049 RepID=A0A177T2S8_9BASI|nr:hypothetical protein A4X13_0g6628 [Tilletia indica]